MCLNLKIEKWKTFKVWEIFECEATSHLDINQAEEWMIPYITRSAENNGVSWMFWNEDKINKGNCITIWAEGWIAFYQPKDFIAWVKIYTLRNVFLNELRAIFIVSLLNQEIYRYSYGRARVLSKICEEEIKLPVNENWNPDRKFMEDYIKSLDHKPLTTKNKPWKNKLEPGEWKFFYLKNICYISMWSKLDFSAMSMNNPKINFVWRSAWNNWVMDKVDAIENVVPYDWWNITVALWWSLWSAYIQKERFYTSQNVAVLKFEDTVSIQAKLFITNCIMNESKYKYFPFWRELNTHIRKDFWFTLPILRDLNGNPIKDKSKKYSEEGDIPDREFMEKYIKDLPYGDRI